MEWTRGVGKRRWRVEVWALMDGIEYGSWRYMRKRMGSWSIV